jgi:drug/metabolite transporter (DMT)-like permease
MIQRIQTLWLLVASVCGFATMKLSFYSGNKPDANNVKQFMPLNATTNTLLTVLTVCVAAACLVLIFMYKDRKRQLLVTLATFAVSIVNIILYFTEIKNFIEGNYDITAILAFLVPLFLLLASWRIYKDERLVKNADRLR